MHLTSFPRTSQAIGVGLLGLMFFAMVPSEPAKAQAGTLSETVLMDRVTGLALMGVDVVAYHVEGRAVPGLAAHELMLEGRVWRFRSEANLAAFLDRPSAYIPLFGGYDPTGIARGLIVEGAPEVFLQRDGRIVLFRNEANRALLVANPALLAEAEKRWPVVKQQLTP